MKGGPGLWMGFMLIVLSLWAVWLNSDISHPRSKERARASLIVVISIGVLSLLAIVLTGAP